MTGPVSRTRLEPQVALHGMGQLLLSEHTRPSLLQGIVELVQQAMPAGAEVSMTLVRDDRPTTTASTGPLALLLDETQYARGYGPCLDAAWGGVVMEIDDARTEDRWPAYVAAFREHGALSMLAVPVPAPHLTAALNVYARTPRAFSTGARADLLQFAPYAGAAQTNMDALQDTRDLADNLQRAMEFRSVIEQAKGILVERYRLTADEAFRLLADASMHTNRKVREIAEALVQTGELPGPTTRQTPTAVRTPPPRSA